MISVFGFAGERNLRLRLRGVLFVKAQAHETRRSDVIEPPNGPVAFFEHTLSLPNPADMGSPQAPRRRCGS